MKPYMILLALPALLLAAVENKNLTWVDEQIKAIKPSRSGLSTHATATLKDPFNDILRINKIKSQEPAKVSTSQPKAITRTEEHKPFYLQAVINSKSAMIDGKWYKVEDKIYGYTIKKIDRATVLLQKRKKKLKLYTASTKSNIKIQTK